MILKFNEFLNENDENQKQENKKDKEDINKLDGEINKTTLEMKKKYLEDLKKKKQKQDKGEDMNESYQDDVNIEKRKLEELKPLIKSEFGIDVDISETDGDGLGFIEFELNNWEFKVYYNFDHESAAEGIYPEQFYIIAFTDDKGEDGGFDLGTGSQEVIDTVKHLMAGTYMEYLDKILR